MPQRIAIIPISMLVLPQYCPNADAASNALQHCRNTYCRNIEAHCRNAPFVASLRQCPLALPQHPNFPDDGLPSSSQESPSSPSKSVSPSSSLDSPPWCNIYKRFFLNSIHKDLLLDHLWANSTKGCINFHMSSYFRAAWIAIFGQWYAQRFESQRLPFSALANTSLMQSLVNTGLSSVGSIPKYAILSHCRGSSLSGILPSAFLGNSPKSLRAFKSCRKYLQQCVFGGNASSPRCRFSDSNLALSDACSLSWSSQLSGLSKK